ncbi:MAG TPA: S8 family serine peptidase [Thermoanaerobaculia bacterium]|jgi:subtilisin family serine protease|nr:S8 family serine peptidase [Thermoanaerobaculia bacterium]
MRFIRISVLVGAVALASVASASATDYVLSANKWTSAQTAAVQAAGGTVVFSHGKAGLGLATSSAPDFLSRVTASGAFQSAAVDEMVQWQPPITDYSVEETAINPTNDTFYPIQWAHQAVQSPAAWAAGCTGQGARVAVLDGGIFAAHPDLDANIDTACSASFVPGQAFNSDTGTFWHGTHVAGIIAAEDNAIGVIGIAPKATIMGVKVLHSGTGSFAWIIGGLLYASDPAAFGKPGCARADIINMSLGAEFPINHNGSLVAALNKAVNFAASNGVLVVSSAGNSGIDFGQAGNLTVVPASSGSGLAISATAPLGWALGATNYDRPASYSNYGEGLVTVAAPGGDAALPGEALCTLPLATGTITNRCWVFDLYLSTSRGTTANGAYSWAAGTSMAAPAASAVAAIIVQRNPGISLGALKAKLQQTSTDSGKIGHDEFYGHGFVNALNACTQ